MRDYLLGFKKSEILKKRSAFKKGKTIRIRKIIRIKKKTKRTNRGLQLCVERPGGDSHKIDYYSNA